MSDAHSLAVENAAAGLADAVCILRDERDAARAELSALRAGIQALADEAEAFHYSREAGVVPQRPNILAALRDLLSTPKGETP